MLLTSRVSFSSGFSAVDASVLMISSFIASSFAGSSGIEDSSRTADSSSFTSSSSGTADSSSGVIGASSVSSIASSHYELHSQYTCKHTFTESPRTRKNYPSATPCKTTFLVLLVGKSRERALHVLGLTEESEEKNAVHDLLHLPLFKMGRIQHVVVANAQLLALFREDVDVVVSECRNRLYSSASIHTTYEHSCCNAPAFHRE